MSRDERFSELPVKVQERIACNFLQSLDAYDIMDMEVNDEALMNWARRMRKNWLGYRDNSLRLREEICGVR